jgi:hypothetical protein
VSIDPAHGRRARLNLFLCLPAKQQTKRDLTLMALGSFYRLVFAGLNVRRPLTWPVAGSRLLAFGYGMGTGLGGLGVLTMVVLDSCFPLERATAGSTAGIAITRSAPAKTAACDMFFIVTSASRRALKLRHRMRVRFLLEKL